MSSNEAARTTVSSLLSFREDEKGPSVDELLPFIYEELREMAHRQLAREQGQRTFHTTDLVHEAYMRLVDDSQVSKKGKAYFFSAAASAMRRVLVDQARKRNSKKRGEGMPKVKLDDVEIGINAFAGNLLDLDDALNELAAFSPRQARVVEYRFFGGLGVEETADMLQISSRTATNDWKLARAWLHRRLKA